MHYLDVLSWRKTTSLPKHLNQIKTPTAPQTPCTPACALDPSLNPLRATEQVELGLHLTSRLLCISTSLRCLIGPNAGFNLHFLSWPPRFAWLFQSAAGLLCLSGGAVGFRRRQPLPERGGGRTRSGTPAADCVSPLYVWPKFTAPVRHIKCVLGLDRKGGTACLFRSPAEESRGVGRYAHDSQRAFTFVARAT